MGKRFEQTLHQRKCTIGQEAHEKCSISLIIWKMISQAMVRPRWTPTSMLEVKEFNLR